MAADLSSAQPPAAVPAPTRRAVTPRKRVIALALCAAALTLAAQAGWIHAKAGLAQWLLHDAWTHTLATGKPHAPWPWADTAPVARLRVPGQGVDQIVLAGDSGRTLAFGPGWAESSAAPGTHGTVVVSGHRDTHFAFLRDLAVGDEVLLQGPAGETRYRVADTRIADARSERLALDAGTDTLWLVTCWPFDALTAGGPMRFAVRAVRTDAVASVP